MPDVTPDILSRDERFSALARLTERLQGLDLSCLLVYLVDLVDVQVLPYLADQFHVMGLEGWSYARTEAERRSLIKRAIELHRYKGTRWAVEQVLVTLGMVGQVSEWFEYDGKAYHFKVRIDVVDRSFAEETYQDLISLIAEYKNVRSHLEMLTVAVSNRSAVPVIAAVTLAGEITTIYPQMPADMIIASPYYIAAGIQFVETTTIYPRNAA